MSPLLATITKSVEADHEAANLGEVDPRPGRLKSDQGQPFYMFCLRRVIS
jgi:hypothetical protein